MGIRWCVNDKRKKGHNLSNSQRKRNRKQSSVRARVEHETVPGLTIGCLERGTVPGMSGLGMGRYLLESDRLMFEGVLAELLSILCGFQVLTLGRRLKSKNEILED